MLKRNLETALICEDDARFDKDLNKIATLAMRDIPHDWDIIHWYTHNESNPYRIHITGNSNQLLIKKEMCTKDTQNHMELFVIPLPNEVLLIF